MASVGTFDNSATSFGYGSSKRYVVSNLRCRVFEELSGNSLANGDPLRHSRRSQQDGAPPAGAVRQGKRLREVELGDDPGHSGGGRKRSIGLWRDRGENDRDCWERGYRDA